MTTPVLGRRAFLRAATARTAAVVGLLARRPDPAGAESPPETPRIRLSDIPDICAGTPLIVAKDFLAGEGFTELQYVKRPSGTDGLAAVAAGDADFSISAVYNLVPRLEAGDPLLILGGIHVGCFDVLGGPSVRSLLDCKGKKIGVTKLGSGRHLLVAMMVAQVGLDPRKDIDWVEKPPGESMRLFAEGKIDGFVAFPPEQYELLAKKVGHVIVSTGTDRPWSQYFCCMVFTNKEFARRHPVATKRALRAILKATSVCALEPERAARLRVDRGHADSSGYALQSIKELPYRRWREYDAGDTVRFVSLRLNEVGFIKATPQKILARGTDWRFLNELKKELKG